MKHYYIDSTVYKNRENATNLIPMTNITMNKNTKIRSQEKRNRNFFLIFSKRNQN